jgi:NAD/NADP transhydrogenase beta subunit
MGMLYGIAGMIALIAAYWLDTAYTYDDGLWVLAVSLIPGAMIGLYTAATVAMTALPEMVGAYNGFGGLAAALTGYGLYLDPTATYLVRHGILIADQTDAMLSVQAVALVGSIVIGIATFTGSFVAAFKLNGMIASKARVLPYRGLTTVVMILAMAVFGALAFAEEPGWNNRASGMTYLILVGVVAGFYGILAIMAIGGGDMPVSICFLNSLSGFSTSATGFMLNSKALVVSGAFVGCSGIILTIVMCQAMNRSVANVLLGGFGEGTVKNSGAKHHDAEDDGIVQIASAADVVEKLKAARSVIIVPGYGMVRSISFQI